MNALQQVEQLLSSMTADEKSSLLGRVAAELAAGFPGVESEPNVCGGETRIVRTRIPVWVLEQARRLGVNDGDLLGSYPTLRPFDLANAWSYVQLHPYID